MNKLLLTTLIGIFLCQIAHGSEGIEPIPGETDNSEVLKMEMTDIPNIETETSEISEQTNGSPKHCYESSSTTRREYSSRPREPRYSSHRSTRTKHSSKSSRSRKSRRTPYDRRRNPPSYNSQAEIIAVQAYERFNQMLQARLPYPVNYYAPTNPGNSTNANYNSQQWNQYERARYQPRPQRQTEPMPTTEELDRQLMLYKMGGNAQQTQSTSIQATWQGTQQRIIQQPQYQNPQTQYGNWGNNTQPYISGKIVQ